MIGDPSGRSKDRESLSADFVQENIVKMSAILSKIFSNSLSLVSVTPAQPVLK